MPTVIRSEDENKRLIAELKELDERHDELTPEEHEYAQLLTVLIESFEDEQYRLKGSSPHTRLLAFVEDRGLRQRDLLPVFGSRGIASEVVKLGPLFHVPADLLL